MVVAGDPADASGDSILEGEGTLPRRTLCTPAPRRTRGDGDVSACGSTLLANRTILAVLSRLNFDRAWFSWKAFTTRFAAAFGSGALDMTSAMTAVALATALSNAARGDEK